MKKEPCERSAHQQHLVLIRYHPLKCESEQTSRIAPVLFVPLIGLLLKLLNLRPQRILGIAVQVHRTTQKKTLDPYKKG